MNADIITIAAPASVPGGEQVIVDVSVKNISGDDQYIVVTAVYELDQLSLPVRLPPGVAGPDRDISWLVHHAVKECGGNGLELVLGREYMGPGRYDNERHRPGCLNTAGKRISNIGFQ